MYHNISCEKMGGEVRAVNYEIATKWLNKVWPKEDEG
jgi:hypothetical protein